ncbi:MAG: ABC transporter permease [Rhodobacteraceae bacterium]|nr:ABC transporter permease [Paracoccaceae bacterium]
MLLYLIFGFWLIAWGANHYLSIQPSTPTRKVLIPSIFVLTILVIWEGLVVHYNIPLVILPAPSVIATTFISIPDILWIDLVQTVFKGALTGFAMGCGAAVLVAIFVDRFEFFKRGLLPIGNLLAALPIVGTAPIFVMWFGFGWQSKAAVVVAMVFFPMLVNMVQGLASIDRTQRDIMLTYHANYWQTLIKLKIPAAMPFAFNGLKICTTLSLIGAIVAEFFGSPTVGMGFRISTEVGRLAFDVVWAEIVVAAIAGTLFFGIVTLIESRVNFWHPSQRR